MFNQIPPAEAGGSFKPSLPKTRKIRWIPPASVYRPGTWVTDVRGH